jgi:PAS domain S-box-containing protein
MLFEFTISSIILFLVGVIALILCVAIWTRRRSPGAVPFLFFSVAVIWWLFARILQSAALRFDDKEILAIVTYPGIASAVIFWLCFTLEYTGITWWKRARYLPLLFLVPVLAILFVIGSLYFDLGWFHITLLADQTDSFVVWSHNPVFWVQITYLSLLVMVGMVVLVRFMLRRPRYYRLQLFIFLIGTLIPGISMLFYSLSHLPRGPIDWLPLTFIFGGLIYAVTIFRFKFLDLVPVARGALLERLPDGILVLNEEGVIADLNPAVKKIGGENTKTELGQRLGLVWPQLDTIRKQMEDGQHTEMVIDIGEKRYVDVSLTEIEGSHGEKAGQLIVLRDITEQKLTQKKMEELYQAERLLSHSLQEEIDKRSKYTRALVHELKTPLTSMLSSSELLEAEVKESLLLALVRNVRRASLNLEQRINELLELARGEIGMLKINAAPMNMEELLSEIISEMSPMATAKGLLLLSEIGKLPPVMGDKSRLRQVMSNLLSNAMKFTSRGAVSVIAACDDSERILVQVKDTGKGIDHEKLDNLFDPYRRKVNEGHDLGGLGIGLALTKMFVELHGGKIWVESQPQKGTVFSFTVPIYKISDAKKTEIFS